MKFQSWVGTLLFIAASANSMTLKGSELEPLIKVLSSHILNDPLADPNIACNVTYTFVLGKLLSSTEGPYERP
jgi:hypothetical protein